MTTIRTVGHGVIDADELGEVLRGAGVTEVVDVRRYPGSRRHPHFSGEAMAAWLPEQGDALGPAVPGDGRLRRAAGAVAGGNGAFYAFSTSANF